MILKVQNKPFSNIYFENLFNYSDIYWTAIYILPRLVTHNTYMRSFQYKILNNILYLNKKLNIFGIKSSPLCCFCNLYEETLFHIFYECDHKFLWSNLVQCFQNTLILSTLTPQTVILRILDSVSNNSFFVMHSGGMTPLLVALTMHWEKNSCSKSDLVKPFTTCFRSGGLQFNVALLLRSL